MRMRSNEKKSTTKTDNIRKHNKQSENDSKIPLFQVCRAAVTVVHSSHVLDNQSPCPSPLDSASFVCVAELHRPGEFQHSLENIKKTKIVRKLATTHRAMRGTMRHR